MSIKTLVIGIGNRYRGDDALGCLIADEVRKKVPETIEVIEHNGEPASLIECWQEYSTVILIDAVSSGAPAGTIHHIDLQSHPLPVHFHNYSTHAFGIAEAIELARVLKKLPPNITFYGIEGKSFGTQLHWSAFVRKAARKLEQEISQDRAFLQ